MTVGELRKVMEGIRDDADVTIFLPENCNPDVKEDYMRHVKSAKYCKPSGISGHELEIVAGDYFGY